LPRSCAIPAVGERLVDRSKGLEPDDEPVAKDPEVAEVHLDRHPARLAPGDEADVGDDLVPVAKEPARLGVPVLERLPHRSPPLAEPVVPPVLLSQSREDERAAEVEEDLRVGDRKRGLDVVGVPSVEDPAREPDQLVVCAFGGQRHPGGYEPTERSSASTASVPTPVTAPSEADETEAAYLAITPLR